MEARLHDEPDPDGNIPSNCFITLTYDDEHLPEDYSVDVEHWKLFRKRLRERIGPFRFYLCGEYGEKNLRPHYHACIFGRDFTWDRQPLDTPNKHPLYESETLNAAWGHGFASIGAMTYETAAYTASYVRKKVTGEKAEAFYRRIHPLTGRVCNVRPEFATMSRRPGLGKAYFDRYKHEIYANDGTVVADGRVFPAPTYFDKLMEEEDPDLMRRVKATRRAKGIKFDEDDGRDRRDRLDVTHIINEAKAALAAKPMD